VYGTLYGVWGPFRVYGGPLKCMGPFRVYGGPLMCMGPFSVYGALYTHFLSYFIHLDESPEKPKHVGDNNAIIVIYAN